MKKLALFCSPLLFITLIACGNSDDVQAPSVSTHTEAPGENCPEGGLRLVVDETTHYICHGKEGEEADAPTLEVVAVSADDEDNPCGADAIKITVAAADGSQSQDEYICQDPPRSSDPFYAAGVSFGQGRNSGGQATCACAFEENGYDSPEECEEDQVIPSAYIDMTAWCLQLASEIIKDPAPEEVLNLISCEASFFQAVTACAAPIQEAESCDEDLYDEYNDCVDQVSDEFDDTCHFDDELAQESVQWLDNFHLLTVELNCGI